MMTDYCVLEAGGANQLSALVNKALIEGWIPQGGVSVVQLDKREQTASAIPSDRLFFQAMVRDANA